MTLAAKELHLTQSGVSQHIKSLEDMIGVKLFDRIQQKLVPSSYGSILFQGCSRGLNEIEKVLWSVQEMSQGKKGKLSGTIRIGLPIEFGNNIVLPLLAEYTKKYPNVNFKIKLGFASAMNELILGGGLDFALVDQYQMDPRMSIEKVCDEVLDLCISEDLLSQKGPMKNTKRYFESLDYVEYQDDAPLLRMWFHHHLGTRHLSLNIRAVVMDVQAISRFILHEGGAGILPGHLVSQLQQLGKKIYRFQGKGESLMNTISIAHLQGRSHSPATLSVLRYLKGALTTSKEERPLG